MVNTRSQNVDSYAACSSGMEQNSDNESEYSFPNTLSRNQINEFENGDLINVRHNSSLNSVDQRFMEMNKQISDLTNIVLALTEKISSSTTECSGLNTVINTNVTRSDIDCHLAVISGKWRASMNHFINVLFETVVSVLLYGLLYWSG